MWIKDKVSCNLFIVVTLCLHYVCAVADSAALHGSSIPERDFVQSNSKLLIWYYDCATSECIVEQLLFHNITNMVVCKPWCI